jgi:hypothetical protein
VFVEVRVTRGRTVRAVWVILWELAVLRDRVEDNLAEVAMRPADALIRGDNIMCVNKYL